MVHRSAAPAPPRTARRTVTYEASYPALAKDAHHPTGGRAGSDEKLDGISGCPPCIASVADGAEPYPQRAGEAGKRNKQRRSTSMTVSSPAECACPMRRNPASVNSIIPSSWQTKSKPASRTSRSIGEGAGTRDGAFDSSLAGPKRSGLDRRVSASSRSTRSISAMALSHSRIRHLGHIRQGLSARAAVLPVCSYSRPFVVLHGEIIRLSETSGVGPLAMRAVELGLATSERIEKI